MNAFAQNAAGFLAIDEAIEAIAVKDQSTLLLLSDTHGHYDLFEAIIKNFGQEADALLFAGDGIWDLVQYIENAQASQKLAEAFPPVAAFVAGNGDGSSYRVSLPSVSGDEDIPPGYGLHVPSRQILKASGFQVFLAHGHRYSVDVSLDILVDTAHAMDCDIAVYGHTHVQAVDTFSHIVAINPGSPARPRGHSPAGFALLTLDSTSIVPDIRFIQVRETGRGNFAFDVLPA